MTFGNIDVYMYGTMLLCAFMAVFNLIKNRKKGWAGVIMSVAFLVLGGAVYLFETGAQPKYVEAVTAVLILLLTADFVIRAGSRPQKNQSGSGKRR